MIVQLWTADFIPVTVPGFLDEHITLDYNPLLRKEEYIFEIDPNHSFFKKVKNVQKAALPVLKEFGFKKPRHFYTGEKPEVLVNHVHTHSRTDMHGNLNIN